MSDLIAIGYPDETTADDAAAEARRLAQDLIIQPDAIAVIVRDKEGKYHTHTSHHMVGGGATWGMFWGLLFGMLFFVPVLGMAVGAGLGALMGKVTKSGVSREFQEQVRDMVQPGTSCLFLILEKATPDKAVAALGQYGGPVLKSSLSEDAEDARPVELPGGEAGHRPASPPPAPVRRGAARRSRPGTAARAARPSRTPRPRPPAPTRHGATTTALVER